MCIAAERALASTSRQAERLAAHGHAVLDMSSSCDHHIRPSRIAHEWTTPRWMYWSKWRPS